MALGFGGEVPLLVEQIRQTPLPTCCLLPHDKNMGIDRVWDRKCVDRAVTAGLGDGISCVCPRS